MRRWFAYLLSFGITAIAIGGTLYFFMRSPVEEEKVVIEREVDQPRVEDKGEELYGQDFHHAMRLKEEGKYFEARQILNGIIQRAPHLSFIARVQELLWQTNIQLLLSPDADSEWVAYYEVQRGDSVYMIAKEFGITADLIIQANDIKNGMIYPKQKLKIIQGKLSILVDKSLNQLTLRLDNEVIKVYSDCTSGSDRIEKAVKSLEANGCDSNIVVNIQGDEPMLEPGIIDVIISRLESDSNAGVATPIAAIKTLEEFLDPSVVKTVIDSCNHALYFSRQPIPHGWSGSGESAFRHIGLYAYRRDILKEFTCWRPCSLEKLEQLEQLRLLHHGVTIAVAVVESVCPGVDTEEDLEKIRKLWSKSWN